MNRLVRHVNAPINGEGPGLFPFSHFTDHTNIVLLGDPGAGKTHLFREESAASGGRFVTARGFLSTPVRATGEVLFIDGLDERRAGRNDRDTVEKLVEKLFTAEPRQVRISCRAQDWLGESDLASLNPFFELGGEPAVLDLQKLSREEQRAVLTTQGMDAIEADAFLSEANERGIADFLENPQNLILLRTAVRGGEWPQTRAEIFELATALMLREENPDRARSGTGTFSVAQLRPVAGAVFAARLISDTEAVSLKDQDGTETIPSYRSLDFLDLDKVQAVLTRRVFVAGPTPESVDYAHRTTAEYVGAFWLAAMIRGGLPFARLQALMGVDGHPAPELRGLHAWLAVHLPEHAASIIEADPYGVLTYGDPASLTREACTTLIEALGRLSQSDPWFRMDGREAPTIGGLSRADMVEPFRAVIRSSDAGFGIRTIVVEALALGKPQPALKDDLLFVVEREASGYAERVYALRALLRLGTNGESALREVYGRLGNGSNGLRLRVEILKELYGRPFGPNDVIALFADLAQSPDELPGGVVWSLPDFLPLHDLSEVLDGIRHRKRADAANRKNDWEIGSFYTRTLVRVWRTIPDIDPTRGLRWLAMRQAFSDSYSSGRDEIQTALSANRTRLTAMLDHLLANAHAGGDGWARLVRFQENTLYLLKADEIRDGILRQLATAERGSAKELFLYDAVFSFCFGAADDQAAAAFDSVYHMADNRSDLQAIRDKGIAARLPGGYLDRKARRNASTDESNFEQQRRDFERDADIIRSGAHLGWLRWLAMIYFARFSDVDRNATPYERLTAILGAPNLPTALEALRATLQRNALPTMEEVIELAANHQFRDWWYAVVAGLAERFRELPDIAAYDLSLLQFALAFDITHPILTTKDGNAERIAFEWKAAILAQQPSLARDVYVAVARAQFEKGRDHIDGLRELLTNDTFLPDQVSIALGFLRDFPNASLFRLDEIFDSAMGIPAAHPEFLSLAARVLDGTIAVGERQRDMWLAAAYLLAPVTHGARMEAAARERPSLIFEIRDRSGFERRYEGQPQMGLSLPQLEAIAHMAGSLWPAADHPTTGWSGDTNAWDASDYFYALTNRISAMPSEAATAALVRLEGDTALASYRPHLLHTLAAQRARRREAEYDRPNWPKTVAALRSGPPATVADLHALVVDQLSVLRHRIRAANTDLFKQFWNVDQYARPIDPRPEEICRDIVVTWLKPMLAPLGVSAEPEGHMAGDRRADISVAMPGRKVLCELKRDYHAEVWTAAEGQLERFYVHDPEAQGFGVYVVFWFGEKSGKTIPAPPGGKARPTSASEMETMLRDIVPAERRHRIVVLLVDVSGPMGV